MGAKLRRLIVCCALALVPVSIVSVGASDGVVHASPATASHTERPMCKAGTYKNVNGKCVKKPGSAPAGASAKCKDGTYSYSTHRSGTCSGHKGVATWY
ncbi:MAG: hypothetical protein JWL72_270 [Ilumatobacteraceae bacterium]|nr:hypothetical protein [Ilumatobacteraceae bacterium]MCU1386932.1 hypothetical protein [Ilumatobacteraceae bacterium]